LAHILVVTFLYSHFKRQEEIAESLGDFFAENPDVMYSKRGMASD